MPYLSYNQPCKNAIGGRLFADIFKKKLSKKLKKMKKFCYDMIRKILFFYVAEIRKTYS